MKNRNKPAADEAGEPEQKEFHPWRLLGALVLVMIALAAAAALIDVLVLGW